MSMEAKTGRRMLISASFCMRQSDGYQRVLRVTTKTGRGDQSLGSATVTTDKAWRCSSAGPLFRGKRLYGGRCAGRHSGSLLCKAADGSPSAAGDVTIPPTHFRRTLG